MINVLLSWKRNSLLILLITGLAGCLGIPDGARPVEDFTLDKYLGKWYEIARLDHSFERGLSNVTAQYSLRDGDGVKVINRGFKVSSGEWEEAEGKAFFVDDTDTGKLKVSFFGPFYGAYNVIALDEEAYQWSLVAGPNTEYLWILSRKPQLEPVVLEQLLAQAKSLGFDTEALIFVDQNQEH